MFASGMAFLRRKVVAIRSWLLAVVTESSDQREIDMEAQRRLEEFERKARADDAEERQRLEAEAKAERDAEDRMDGRSRGFRLRHMRHRY